MRPTRALLLALAICALSATACSGSGDEPTSTPVKVQITEDGGEITSSQDVVEAERGQEIELVVSSDAADEFHVHSDPEHEFSIKNADDQTFTFSLDTAGEYEMESHELEVTVLKLQIG